MTTTPDTAVEFAPHFRSHQIHARRDEAVMRSVFELRFQVYCVECGFLSPADYPDHRETDEYDPISAHFRAVNLKNDLVGYVRLVRPHPMGTFPFQTHCTALFDGVALPPHAESAEISRLMVRKDYRRRRGDTVAGVTACGGGVVPEHERRDNSPQILLSMYRQMYKFSLANGIRYWYAAMERSLARALLQMDFGFRQIGPQTDYYGPVAPYLADLRELELRVGESEPELLAWMQQRESEDA